MRKIILCNISQEVAPMSFKEWLKTKLSSELSKDLIAYNFNLYENDTDVKYDVQLVGSMSYDVNDDDWACNICYSSGEDIFSFDSVDWETALDDFITMAKEAVNGDWKSVFGDMVEYVSAGFVDGDLVGIYKGL